MKISKGTIIRLIAFIIVSLNLVLKACGKPIINVDDSIIAGIVEGAITLAVYIVTFWKNNSFSQAAIKADEFLKKLKEGK